MKTSIIIPAFNKKEYTAKCVDSIRRYTQQGTYELIVVDDHSSDGTHEWLSQQPDIRVITNDENMGFPVACNRGMEIATGENILLLNNDTLVTDNWLTNLLACLNSSDEIGAVGPVTNYSCYYQEIPVDYNTLEEMQVFAKDYNISNPERWEQRIKLIGFCLLIKRIVIDNIGMFDERFTPGHFEDDDYSVRMRRAGYKLMLCRDTFIYHFGGVSFNDTDNPPVEKEKRSALKFEEKWGFRSEYYSYIRQEIVDSINAPKDKPIKVLDVGCGCGATLLQIKNRYKNAVLHGLELNEAAAIDARLYADVRSVDIEQATLDYPKGYFDYMIFCDVLEHLYDPWKALKNMGDYLAWDGKILASIPNTMHYSIIRGLLNGQWTYEEAGLLDWTHIRFFTLNEIIKLFTETGYPYVAHFSRTPILNQEDTEFIEWLGSRSDGAPADQFKAYQYFVKASRVKFSA